MNSLEIGQWQTRERRTTASSQRPLACLDREREAYLQRGHIKQEIELE